MLMKNGTLKSMPHGRGYPRRSFVGQAAAGAGLLAMAALMKSSPSLEAAENSAASSWQKIDEALGPMEEAVERFMWVPRKDGRLLNLLVRLTRGRKVLEVGTSVGFSAIWLAAALKETGGQLTTVELLPERVEQARKNLGALGLARQVQCLAGNGHEIVPTLKGSFDLVLLDADKSGHVDYFQKLHPRKLSPRVLVISNNAITPREGMKEYLQLLMNHPNYDSVTLSTTLEDGYCLSFRKGQN
jgi:predicted O-methyltransferase YrrM